jgi:4-alpha-glucanotransferase
MAQQMRAVSDDARRGGLGLYLDFPLGVSPQGYDAWRYAEHFAKNVSVGSPPDSFFTKGQNWGFPPLDPDAIRARHHSYFRACVRRQLEHAGVLRIDHVMGLHRLFWIPNGGEAKDGVYVRYPADELYAALLIEANRTGSVIVGEDLGTVPEYVPDIMRKHGIRRMYVVQYEIKPEGDEPIGKPSAQSIASINTHDMPTFAGFWGGKDIDDRVDQELLDDSGAAQERETRARMRNALTTYLKARTLLPGEAKDTGAVLEALLRFLGRSEAEMVLVNIEDLWLEEEPQNVPGVPDRSWRQRLRLPLEQAAADDAIARLLRTVDESRRMDDGNAK